MLVRVSAGLFWLPAGTGSAGGGGGWVDCGTPVLGINRVLGRWFSLFFFLFSVPPPSPAFSVVSFTGKKLPSYPLSVPIGSQSVSQPVSQLHWQPCTLWRLHTFARCVFASALISRLFVAGWRRDHKVQTALHCNSRHAHFSRSQSFCRCCKNNKTRLGKKAKNQGVFPCRDQLCCCCCCCCTVILFCCVLFLLSFRLVYCYFSSFLVLFFIWEETGYSMSREHDHDLWDKCALLLQRSEGCLTEKETGVKMIVQYSCMILQSFFIFFDKGAFWFFYFVFTTTTTTSLLVTFSLGSQTFSFAINSPSYDWTDLDHFFFLFLFTFAPLHFSFHCWQCTYFLFSPFLFPLSLCTQHKSKIKRQHLQPALKEQIKFACKTNNTFIYI